MPARALLADILRLAQLPSRIGPAKCLILCRSKSCGPPAHKHKISGRLLIGVSAERPQIAGPYAGLKPPRFLRVHENRSFNYSGDLHVRGNPIATAATARSAF